MATADYQQDPYSTDPAQTQTQQTNPYKYAWQGSNSGQVLGSRIASAYNTYYGYAPDFDTIWNQRLAWDRMPDENFMQKILNDIRTQGAAYKSSQQPAAAPSTTSGDPTPAPPAPPTGGGGGGAATGSPVTATGQIAPAPAQAPQAQPSAARVLSPYDVSKIPGYTATDFTRALPDAYQAGNITQFSGPNQSEVNGLQSALVRAILTNPETLSPSVVSQLKEQQKESALSMAQQNQSLLDRNAVARHTLGGGTNDALARTNLQQALDSILNSNREIDIKAAQTNRSDELAALAAAENIAQGQQGRAVSGYGATLSGEQAREAAAQAAAQSALQRGEFGFNVDKASADDRYRAEQASLDQALKQFQINQAISQNAQQNYQQDLAAEFGRNSSNLDLARYLEQQRQFNDTLGFNYNQLDQQSQAAILAAILGKL